MKTAITIWLVAAAIAIGGLIFFNRTLDERKASRQPVPISAFCNGGLDPEPDFCATNLKTIDNYGEQTTVNVNRVQGGL